MVVSKLIDLFVHLYPYLYLCEGDTLPSKSSGIINVVFLRASHSYTYTAHQTIKMKN